jgi:hypothetical protein
MRYITDCECPGVNLHSVEVITTADGPGERARAIFQGHGQPEERRRRYKRHPFQSAVQSNCMLLSGS